MIKVIYEPENRRVAVYDGNKNIGECTYSEPDTLGIIDHTLVDSEYGGQGIAGKLVAEVVNAARLKKAKIVPLCPFAKESSRKKQNMLMYGGSKLIWYK